MKERVNFHGYVYKRDLESDHMNNKENIVWRLNLRIIACVFITLFIYAVSLGISFGLFYAKKAVINSLDNVNEDWAYLNHNIINSIEVLKIMFFDFIFYKVAVKMVLYINPKYMHDFERYVINFISIFSLMNNLFVIVIIVFFKDSIVECAELSI